MKIWFFFFGLLCTLILAGAAYAQDIEESPDDPPADPPIGSFTSTVDFSAPSGLAPNTNYDFTFVVSNTTVPSSYHRWITDVELHMPSIGYIVDESSISSPDPLHNETDWSYVYWSSVSDKRIHWRNIGYWRVIMGDIHEGESLAFSFRAKTDGVPTDGFDWQTTADNMEIAAGTAYVGIAGDDTSDDDTAGDDTSNDDDLIVDDTGGSGDDEWSDDDWTNGDDDTNDASLDNAASKDSTGASCGC